MQLFVVHVQARSHVFFPWRDQDVDLVVKGSKVQGAHIGGLLLILESAKIQRLWCRCVGTSVHSQGIGYGTPIALTIAVVICRENEGIVVLREREQQ